MAFEPKDWKDEPDHSTPITAAALKDLEERVTSEAALPSSVVTGSGVAATGNEVPRATGTGNGITWVKERINVKALGQVAGVAAGGDYSAVVATAISGLTAAELYFPADPNGYKLNLEVGEEAAGKGVSLRFTSDGPRATFLAPVDATHPIVSIVGPADSTNHGTSFENIGIKNTGHREYVGGQGTGHPLIRLNFCRDYRFVNVQLDGGNYEGTLIAAESAYNAHFEDMSMIRGKYAIPFLHTNTKKQPGSEEIAQCDNWYFDRVTLEGPGPVFRNGGNEMHQIVAKSLKVVSSPYGSFVAKLAAEVKAGDTTFTYEAPTGVPAVGDVVVLGNDGAGRSSDYARVIGVNEGTKTVEVSATNPFKFAHAKGAPVINSGIAFSIGDNAHLIELFGPHFEGQVVGLAVGNVQKVDIHAYEMVCAYGILYCGGTIGGVEVHSLLQGGTSLANELFKKSADNPGGSIGIFKLHSRPFVPEGSKTAVNAPESSSPYTWEALDESGGNNPITRKNVNSGGNNPKARAWEATVANATKVKIQHGGRGYFADSVSVGDLGSITGKTSAEIDALFAISPADATSAGTLLATAELEGKRVVLARKTGAGNKWQVSPAYTEIA